MLTAAPVTLSGVESDVAADSPELVGRCRWPITAGAPSLMK